MLLTLPCLACIQDGSMALRTCPWAVHHVETHRRGIPWQLVYISVILSEATFNQLILCLKPTYFFTFALFLLLSYQLPFQLGVVLFKALISLLLMWHFLGKCLAWFQDPAYHWTYFCAALTGYKPEVMYKIFNEAIRSQTECWQQDWRRILESPHTMSSINPLVAGSEGVDWGLRETATHQAV